MTVSWFLSVRDATRFKKRKTSKPSMSSFTLSVNELIKLAQKAYDEFSPGVAAKYYEDAIKQQPNNANLYHKLALMYVEYGEPQQAHKISIYQYFLSNPSNLIHS